MGLAPVYGVDQAVAPRGLDNVDIDIVDGESPDSMSDEYSLDYPKITSDEQLIKVGPSVFMFERFSLLAAALSENFRSYDI